jgi:hypothetical protein
MKKGKIPYGGDDSQGPDHSQNAWELDYSREKTEKEGNSQAKIDQVPQLVTVHGREWEREGNNG